MANTLNVQKAFEAIAKILSARENTQITVLEVKKKEKTKEEPA